MSLLDFIGGYWWLAFPLLGAVGAVAGTWEKSARNRHERRLEVMRLKGELKAAQTGATPLEARPDESQSAQLARLFAAHDAVTARWLDYELDVAKLIAFPAMSDGRQPLTAAFLRAQRVADSLRPDSVKARLTAEQLREYREAVTDYEVAFEVAERDARRVKDSSFSDAERKRLDTAKQLLTVAVDQAATPAERQLAYRRVREELDGLLSLSDEAIDVLEQRVALELPATADAGGAAPGADPVRREPAPGTDSAPPAATGPSTSPTEPRVPLTPPRPEPPHPPAASTKPSPPSDTAPGRIVRPKPRP
ncbi:hypothetical protein ACTU3I_01775 [Microbacterium sp. RD1]|uniref:hypothetical protein n=1 Tax=Microbacterium sp. RD1 TaxID=3457313 RepID=UPI003FA5327D